MTKPTVTMAHPNDASRRTIQTTAAAAPCTSALASPVVLRSIAILAASSLLAIISILYSLRNNDNDDASLFFESDYDDHDSHHRTLLQSTSHRHKPLFPLDASDHYGFFYATLGLMIAAGGGIGGGGVLVPIYILVMKFSPKHAIPLSNITILGGALANTVLNVPKRHPLADRPLVDWDLILVMEPPAIAGALVGAVLNKVLPEGVVMISLVVLLSYTAYETLKKAVRMYRAETRAFLAEKGKARVRSDGTKESELTVLAREMDEEEEEEEIKKQGVALLDNVGRQVGDNPGDMKQSSNQNCSINNQVTVENGQGIDNDDDQEETEDVEDGNCKHSYDNIQKEEEEEDAASTFSSATELRNKEDLARILEEERHIPKGNIQALFLTLAVVIIINLLKGGGAYNSPLGIQCGTTSYWLANGSMLLWILVVMTFARSYLNKRHRMKERCGYPYVEGDIKWDSRATIVYPIICSAAGFCAGMFGIGGGIVKGPLMLAMGVHPKVASAASACMILLTAFAATTSFMVFGLLDYEYAGICMVLGFIATFVGQIGLSYLMQKYQRNSYIAFSIGGIVLLSAFLITIQSLLSMADKGGPRPPSGLCSEQQ
ncbi:hypothetical protein ACHAWU_009196 [Discostella pseudostelligera]|uniref:Sulfite exporter TauE/SafE family protein n=1 Tax=Discostella pseudostelligera TaxID=259834 RepID=A0ABD3MIS6_9STRA